MVGRWILGISFFNAAIWKIFVLTPIGHTHQFFLNDFANTWIPSFMLWPLGLTIPFVELLIGVFLCVGFRAREAAFIAGLLLMLTTYGHSLLDPLYNMSQGLTFSRVALVLFLLIASDSRDVFSMDCLLSKIKKKVV